MSDVDITLTEVEIEDATELAAQSLEKYHEIRGHYPNTPENHRLGRLAKVGVERWLRESDFDVQSAFRDPERDGESDLIVGQVGVKVKSWRPDTWNGLGRCITPGQLRTIERNSDVVLWCVVDDPYYVSVDVRGWSSPSEIAEAEIVVTGRDQIANHQVHEYSMRTIRDFLTLLEGAA